MRRLRRLAEATLLVGLGITAHNVLPLLVRALELRVLAEENPELIYGSKALEAIEKAIQEILDNEEGIVYHDLHDNLS